MPLPNQLPDDFIARASNKATLIGNRYSIIKRIGSGNFGTAFLIDDNDVTNEKEKKKVLKQICVGPLDPGETVDAMHEAELLSKMKHKNIVQFHQSFMDGQFFCIVLEYCEGGDLECRIKSCKKKNEIIPEDQVVCWLKQLLRAISYMHDRRVLHRDLKSRNIFLKDNQIKIGDFGISRILIGTTDKASTFVGTPYYMSPEVLNHEEYDEKCDIWSLGCVLYEICCFDHAFNGSSLMDVMMKIVSQHTPQLSESYSRGLNILLQRMLDRDVKKRHTAKQILMHPLLRRVETLPKNSQKLLTARDRLRIKKQKEADAKMLRLKEIAKMKQVENERIRKESQERNFTRSSFDVNMEVQGTISPKQVERLSTINDDELHGTAVFKPVEDDGTVNHEAPFPTEMDDAGTLKASFGSTEDLIRTLIQEGAIPEDGELADTFYSLHDDFETSSDEDLPDDRVELSDSEYRDMMDELEDALQLDASVLSRQSVPTQFSSQDQSLSKFAQILVAQKPQSSPKNLTDQNQTFSGFLPNQSRPIEKRPMTALPHSEQSKVPHSEQPISHFAANMMEQRIANMRLRCISRLGESVFEQAYAIAKNLRFDDLAQNTATRGALTELVADKNHCMLLEQLIYLEKEAASEIS